MNVQLVNDAVPTLEEILALVDTFEWDDVDFNEHGIADEDLDSAVEASASASTGMDDHNDPKLPPKKRRRIRTGWSSSTGLQRRKKAELQFLRAHVQELETYLEQLKRVKTS
ncbi:unnamed protein product [Phytophthora fragariaefolia]|uniref:Unnamed protein product n=1 Tax=Phytophthora fragariaefolia TaxID=1490495 RepID=A0A9W6YFE0_9STRA|nr:unnamed protein product [Phytophthora fragariaefolia]